MSFLLSFRPLLVAAASAAFAAIVAMTVSSPMSAALAADAPVEAHWAVRTADDEQGAGRENFAFEVTAGQRIDDAMVMSNYGESELTLDVYAADGFTTESGQLDVLPRSTPSTQLGTWITVGIDTVTLAPGESRSIPVSLAVPQNATPGDYAGGIVTSLASGSDSAVAVDRRLGIRVQIRVDGELQPRLTLVDPRIEYEGSWNPFAPGSATVTYAVRNDGNTRSTADQSVSVGGPFGLGMIVAEPVEPVPDLLPGDAWQVVRDVEQVLPLFWLTATISLSPSQPAEFARRAIAEPVAASAGGWAVPWPQLALAALMALVVWATVRARRRRRTLEEARIAAAVAEALTARREPREALGVETLPDPRTGDTPRPPDER